MAQDTGEAESVFYVYLLLKTPIGNQPISGAWDLGNVLYAGKGKGYRWRSHYEEALSDAPGLKAGEIRYILGNNPSSEDIERHSVIVAGHLSEAEALRLEAVMIHLVGGPSTVTNLVSGHKASELMVPAFEARVFFGAEDLPVDAWTVQGTPGRLQVDLLDSPDPGSPVFVVKGTAASLTEGHWRRTDELGRYPNSIRMVETSEPSTVRRGWNPRRPWSPNEASVRARRFWSGSKQSIDLWQQLIQTRGGLLALMVPDPRDQRSVVRYMWKVDPKGKWEDYGNRFGFPLGEPVVDHPWLGKRLVDRSTGRGLLKSPASPALTLYYDTNETHRLRLTTE